MCIPEETVRQASNEKKIIRLKLLNELMDALEGNEQALDILNDFLLREAMP